MNDDREREKTSRLSDRRQQKEDEKIERARDLIIEHLRDNGLIRKLKVEGKVEENKTKTEFFEDGLSHVIQTEECDHAYIVDGDMAVFADDIEEIRCMLKDIGIYVSHVSACWFWRWRSEDWGASWLGINRGSVCEFALRMVEIGSGNRDD